MLPYASFTHCAYVSIRQHTSRVRSSSDVAIRQFHPLRIVSPTAHTSAYVSIRHAYGAPAVLPYASFTHCVCFSYVFLSLILTYAYSRTVCERVCVSLSHTCTISAAIDGGDSRPIRMAEFLPAHKHSHVSRIYLFDHPCVRRYKRRWARAHTHTHVTFLCSFGVAIHQNSDKNIEQNHLRWDKYMTETSRDKWRDASSVKFAFYERWQRKRWKRWYET